MNSPMSMSCGKTSAEARGQRGLTIVEMVITIVILAISLVAISAAISGGISRSSDVLIETRAVALAQSYLDEILGKRFDENSAPRGIPPCIAEECTAALTLGPEADELACGTPRICFDDVDDYLGLDEGYDQPDPLLDAEGVERTDYENYRVRVNVRYIDPCAGADEEFLNAAPETCMPEDPEAETDLLNAIQTAKLVTVTVSHLSNNDGWHFSVYKANF